MNLYEALKKETSWTTTENGQDCLNTTFDGLLDFFADVVSFRTKSDDVITQKFNKAFSEDPLLAMKLLFYARNIRGTGQGERRTARIIYKYLAMVNPNVLLKNIKLIGFFGRFDDYYALVDTPLEKEAFMCLKEAFEHDLNSNDDANLTLVGKWLKSINTSSVESQNLGRLTAKYFNLTEKQYRKALVILRAKVNVVEQKLCTKNYDEIVYEYVPSKAMANYRKAFWRNDKERFNNYVESLKKGETKVNSKTLYPYEILEKMNLCCEYDRDRNERCIVLTKDDLLQAQWDNLPNYISGENDCLIVADTSGSMAGRPLCVALSLAVYLAERNKGIWHNKFITFSSTPKFIEMKGNTLFEKLNGVPSIIENTNIYKTFKLILNSAVNNNLSKDEMVKKIIIVSDMQFDSATDGRTTITDKIRREFEEKGYDLPEIVFWNASQYYGNTFHADKDEKGIQMVSGCNPSIFKQVLTGVCETAYEQMINILSDEIFDSVQI